MPERLTLITPGGTKRFVALILLVIFVASQVWAGGPTRAVLVVWDTGDDTQFERYSQLIKALKDLRGRGKFETVAGLDRSIKVYDFNQKAHAQALKSLQLARRKDTPFLAVVSMTQDGVPGKVMWGKKVTDAEAAVIDLQRQLGIAVKPLPSPTVSATPLPPTNVTAPGEGWVRQGNRWQHAEGISIAAPASYTVKDDGDSLFVKSSGALAVTLCPALGETRRKQVLAVFLDAWTNQYPDTALGGPQLSGGGALKVSMQEVTRGSLTFAVGSVTVGERSLIFLASFSGTERSEFLAILQSVTAR